MSLRLKLILSFIVASLVVVTAFGFAAYTSAREYTLNFELAHIAENNQHLISMLGTDTPMLENIQQMIPHHENDELFIAVLDSYSKEFVYTRNDENQNIVNAITKQLDPNENQHEGTISIGDSDYLWAIDPIPGSPYSLLSTHKNSHEKNINAFMKYIATPLGIAAFFGMWFALWAATILANLFKRIDDQKTEIEHQAHHDPLTSLPNRQSIDQIIQDAIRTNKNEDESLLLCLVDIHGLKDINDSLGHESGDKILRSTSDRLKEVLRTSDRVGRFGGDKFAVILTHSKNTATDELCNRLLSAFDRTFQIDGHSLYIGATLGIANYPDHANNSLTLIQKAEVALHTAKDSSKDFFIYDSKHDRGNAAKLNLANDLRNAIRDGDLQLHYQPQLDLRTEQIVSVEALARWIHPEQGFIPPDIFIDIAERTGLIKQLTEWVLATAFKQCAMWRKLHRPISVAINLSARNLHDETLSKQISRLIRHWQIIPDNICLEITETAMMADPQHAKKLLDEFDNLGLRISIDDFGTGYSSLGYLKKLPVDEIKIDRSFVMNMNNDENDASIIRATVGLAHDLGLSVVAEGVEDQESLEKLRALGCEFAQGYHISRPVPADEITKLLESSRQINETDLKEKVAAGSLLQHALNKSNT